MALGCPDGSSSWYDDQSALGHALLRTSPFDDGERPLTHGGGVWITADARLDGREDLIHELKARGRDARSAESDAALVLHAYHVWGEGCVEHLMGDFAFVVRDQPAGRLFCARDHFGVSPLYYAELGTTLVVASSAAALRSHPGVGDSLDDAAIADFLLFGMYMDQAATAHAKIRRLPPAHVLTWSGGRARVRPYWIMPRPGRLVRFRSAQDYVDRFRDLLTTAVADRLGDGPLTTHLSGGLDSTSVTVTAHRILVGAGRQSDLRAQTVRADTVVPTNDEARYAGLVAEALGITADVLTPGDFPAFDPFSPPAALRSGPTPYRPAPRSETGARVAPHGRVLLSGYGADPLLLFEPSYWMDHLARGHPFRLAVTIWDHLRLFHRPPRFYLRPALRYRLGLTTPPIAPLPDWLGGDAVSRARMDARCREVMSREKRHIGISGMSASPLWNNLFCMADPGFTGEPVRGRHPFFDLRLVRYAVSLPPVPWLPRKQILRDAMSGLLPEAVRQRPKTPFGVDAHAVLTAKRGLDPRLPDLVAEANGIAAYVDSGRLISRVRALSAGGPRTGVGGAPDFGLIANALGLSYWFYHRRGQPRASLPSATHRDTAIASGG
jgi:asparagine synthase (glutamine-hydrolysing)